MLGCRESKDQHRAINASSERSLDCFVNQSLRRSPACLGSQTFKIRASYSQPYHKALSHMLVCSSMLDMILHGFPVRAAGPSDHDTDFATLWLLCLSFIKCGTLGPKKSPLSIWDSRWLSLSLSSPKPPNFASHKTRINQVMHFASQFGHVCVQDQPHLLTHIYKADPVHAYGDKLVMVVTLINVRLRKSGTLHFHTKHGRTSRHLKLLRRGSLYT